MIFRTQAATIDFIRLYKTRFSLGLKPDSQAICRTHRVHLADLISDTHSSPHRITSLSTGLHHVVVILDMVETDGSQWQLVVGWGMSRHAQLGHTTSPSSRLPSHVSTPCLIEIDSSLGRVVSVRLGHQHTVLLHESGRVTGLGSDRKSQLQGLEHWSRVCIVGCTWNGTYAAIKREDGLHILSAGDNKKGQLGSQGSPDELVQFPFTSATHRLLDMACGSEHVLCLFQTRSPSSSDWSHQSPTEVWGWGWNEHGNLGVGNTEDAPVPIKMWPPQSGEQSAPGGNAKAIWAG
ncbi:RCC1/BLIP-II protein, partial [Neolentinus lepideus HHB14362 ss-1]